MSSPCTPNVAGAGDLNNQESEALLQRMRNLAEQRSQRTGEAMSSALKSIAGEIRAEDTLMSKIYERNALLSIQAKRNIKDFAIRHPTLGAGLRAFLEGGSRVVQGSRLSVDYQSKALHGKYFGRLVADLESEKLLKDFKRPSPELVKDIYREMGAMHPGQPAKSVSGNDRAFKMATIIDNLTSEMVARQNRAGAFITRMPGYVARQTHDMQSIRALGSLGNNAESKAESYAKWSEFVKPLLDYERTFKGADPEKVLRNVHEALYTGIHGAERAEENVSGISTKGSLANKVSQQRVLHFQDADAAYKYNETFGVKNFKEAILQDVHNRSRSIALMESMGPSPDNTLQQVTRELQDMARGMDDAGKQVDSLRDWKIGAAFNEITGRNEISANPSLSNIVGTAKIVMQMAKMGSVTLSSLADRAFLQSEMAYQGINNLHTLAKQVTGFFKRTPEEKQALRLMGVAMDGLIGNSLSRYSSHSTTSGWAHATQKRFFDLNLLNEWTDVSKASAAELMAAHLGENSHLSFEKLPADLSKVLSLYDINPSRWDAIRSATGDVSGQKFVTPEQIKNIPSGNEPFKSGEVIPLKNGHSLIVVESSPDSTSFHYINSSGEKVGHLDILKSDQMPTWSVDTHDVSGARNLGLGREAISLINDRLGGIASSHESNKLASNMWKKLGATWIDDSDKIGSEGGGFYQLKSNTIADLVKERGLTVSDTNIARERDRLETSLRTYFADRVDIAIPTPGASERKFSTWNTQAGTPLGEAVRLIMLFKSFPITVMNKVMARNIYGNGAQSLKQWLLSDHRGKLNLAMLMAMGTAAGYVSGAVRDSLSGKEPKPLILEDGSINMGALNDAALRGGSLGILGDTMLSQYNHDSNSFLDSAAGPMISQIGKAFAIKTDAEQGKNVTAPIAKLAMDNTPFMNLFYARPLLNYFALWHMQEMLSPGSLRRSEAYNEKNNHQQYWMRPSDVVNR